HLREKMESVLSEAAVNGSVSSLLQLLKEDPLLLDRTIVSCIAETPLHTAAMLGHVEFVAEVLSHKPELAAELDSLGNSPLHLAATKGHVEVVRRLLAADPEMGLVRNLEGRAAAHVAAAKGRAGVLAELVQVMPESTRVLTDRGETALHLCVKHGRLEAMKVLLDQVVERDGEVVNWKDCEGNSVLHIAVAKKQIELVKFLLSTIGVEVNALNSSSFTALDILLQSPRDLRDLDIEDQLRSSGALTAKDLHLITNDSTQQAFPQTPRRLSSQESKSEMPQVKHHIDWLGRKRSALMVVASLIATVAFQAALTPPGGVWQDDYQVDSDGKPVEKPHAVGESIMAYREPLQYGQFMIFNTIAFLTSLSIILLLVSGLPLRRRRWMWIQMIVTWIAITAQVMTYFVSLRNMSPKDDDVQGMLREVTEISVLTWLTLMVVIFILNAVRMTRVIKSHGYVKKIQRRLTSRLHRQEEEESYM
ncbi:hypothetical protein RJ639_012221, partial [Escallonia herrerae]